MPRGEYGSRYGELPREERLKDALQTLEHGIDSILSSEVFASYLQMLARFHSYSFGNVVLIWTKSNERWGGNGRYREGVFSPNPSPSMPAMIADDTCCTVSRVRFKIVLGYPDGRLDEEPVEELAQHIVHAATDVDALLVFDEGGITGHPDHRAATRAALAAAQTLDLPVLAWTIPPSVAAALNAEYGTTFVPREDMEHGIEIEVDRTLQLKAIACHRSQCSDNPVLWRRLELQGTREYLVWLWPPG
jgi:hypothetical protein